VRSKCRLKEEAIIWCGIGLASHGPVCLLCWSIALSIAALPLDQSALMICWLFVPDVVEFCPFTGRSKGACLLACCLIAPHRGNNIRSALAAGGQGPRGTVARPTCVCRPPVRVVIWSLSGCHGVLLLSLSCTCCCAHVP
jgi:hypothetical protein